MILVLWTSTSGKAQVSRRFSLTYPQAITVINGAQIDPIVAAAWGDAGCAMGPNWGGSM